MMTLEEAYATLGADATLGSAELRTRYRLKLLRYHPDRNQGNEMASRMTEQVVEAYATIIGQRFEASALPHPPIATGYTFRSTGDVALGMNSQDLMCDWYVDVVRHGVSTIFHRRLASIDARIVLAGALSAAGLAELRVGAVGPVADPSHVIPVLVGFSVLAIGVDAVRSGYAVAALCRFARERGESGASLNVTTLAPHAAAIAIGGAVFGGLTYFLGHGLGWRMPFASP